MNQQTTTPTPTPYEEDIKELFKRCEIFIWLAGVTGLAGGSFVLGFIYGIVKQWFQ